MPSDPEQLFARSKTQCQLLAGRIRLMRNKRQIQVRPPGWPILDREALQNSRASRSLRGSILAAMSAASANALRTRCVCN